MSSTEMNQNTGTSNNLQYSQALRTRTEADDDFFPPPERAILIHKREGLTQTDYVVAVGNIVQPKNVRFASSISNNRFCIYLSSTQLVDFLVREHSTLVVKDQEITLRRLITPARRLIVSNVAPSIPHRILEDEIEN